MRHQRRMIGIAWPVVERDLDTRLLGNLNQWARNGTRGDKMPNRGRVLQFSAVDLGERRKLAALLAVHLSWGLVLWFSISKYGLGVSTDSVQLMFGGLNLADGRGLTSFDGSFLLLWPPLYPGLLALIHLVTGLDTFAGAHLIQAAAYVGVSLCLSILFMNIFRGKFLLALFASVLSDVGAVVLTSFDEVGSDYVHLLLVMLCVLLAGSYLETKSRRSLIGLVAVGMLAMLERYLGVAAIVMAVVVVMLPSIGNLRQRFVRGLAVLASALPATIWLVTTAQLYDRRDPISFGENFHWFSRSILEWFFPFKVLNPHLEAYIAYLWIVVLGLVIMVVSRTRTRKRAGVAGRPAPRSFALPLFLFGACYTVALFGAASVSYSNKLRGRFLLPVYIPFVTMLVSAAAIPVRGATEGRPRGWRIAGSALAYGTLAASGMLLLHVTLPLVVESHANGATGGDNAFNTREWQENQAVKFWLGHAPHGPYMLLSNEPDGAAFISGHATGSVPRKTTGPYGTESFPLSTYASELFASNSEVYILWKEPNFHDYLYSVDDMRPIAQVETLFVSNEGGVYRLQPKTGSQGHGLFQDHQ
jgi:hypothetical protein